MRKLTSGEVQFNITVLTRANLKKKEQRNFLNKKSQNKLQNKVSQH